MSPIAANPLLKHGLWRIWASRTVVGPTALFWSVAPQWTRLCKVQSSTIIPPPTA
jgi:hypothetical protein